MQEARIALPGTPSSVGAARRFAREWLQTTGVIDDEWTVLQVVSELTTNAVVHARTALTLTISYDDSLVRVGVMDAKPLARASVRKFSNQNTTGRGLQLIQLLGESWGVEQSGATKTVWCVLRRSALVEGDADRGAQLVGLTVDANAAFDTKAAFGTDTALDTTDVLSRAQGIDDRAFPVHRLAA